MAWLGPFLGGEVPAGASLAGDAYLDGGFGAFLDGDGDYIALGPNPTTDSYAASGLGFSISMWYDEILAGI